MFVPRINLIRVTIIQHCKLVTIQNNCFQFYVTVFVSSIRIVNEADLIADADSVVNPPEDLRPLESLVPGADVVRVTDVLDQQLGRHVDLALENISIVFHS